MRRKNPPSRGLEKRKGKVRKGGPIDSSEKQNRRGERKRKNRKKDIQLGRGVGLKGERAFREREN